MRFYHKVACLAVFALSTPAWAQYGQQYGQQGEDVDDDEAYAQPGEGMPPPDPRAYVQYGYMGSHPVPYEVGSGFCYQPGAHFHQYAPFDQYLFREQGGWFYFVGDPGDFGYAQQMWGYSGHHPVPGPYGGGYCFIDWAHRHYYAPPPNLQFNFVGGYYVYGGGWDPSYWRWRQHYASYYGGYYRRSYYGGAYWRVRPPPIYRPQVVVGAPGAYRPGVVAVAPGGARVRVVAPPPPAPGVRAGVVVGAPRPYAPGPPRPYAPAPQRPYAPAPQAVGPPRPVAPHPVPAPRPVAPPPGHGWHR